MFGNWFKRRRPSEGNQPVDLEEPLFFWGEGESCYSVRESCAGTSIMGSSGSGKSTGSLRHLCCAMFGSRAKYGALACTVKKEDADTYVRYADEAGRASDVIVYSPANPIRFDFVATEIAQSPDRQSIADNLTVLIMTVARLGDSGRGGAGGEHSEFFKQASERLCRLGLLVLVMSGQAVTIPNLYRLLISVPRSRTDGRKPEWQASSYFFSCVRSAEGIAKSDSERADFEMAVLFFMEENADADPRTRANIEGTLTAAIDALARGTIRDALSAPPEARNFDPAMLSDGKIIVLDYPVLVHSHVGRLLQIVVKYCVMRSLSRRTITKYSRPVLLVVDEAQHLLTEHDALFATTARSTRTALIYATQSASTLLEAFGARDGEARMHGFLGNCSLHVHHMQVDTRTIHLVQQMAGQSRELHMNGNTTRSQDWLAPLFGEPSGGSAGFSEAVVNQLEASDLMSLARGGPHGYTEAIVFRGAPFSDGRTWRRVRFKQGNRS